MAEWVEWIKIGGALLMFPASILLSVLGFLVRSAFRDNKEAHAQHRTKFEQIERSFLEFQARMPRDYVLKDDHIRHVTILEKKIDDLRVDLRDSLALITTDIKTLLRESPKRNSDGQA